MYDVDFITEVKKRERLSKVIKYVTIGAFTYLYIHTWTWDGQILTRDSGIVEKTKDFMYKAPLVLFASVYYFTSIGNNHWPLPSGWNNNNNTIECIGSGGNGYQGNQGASGGGGGGYSKSNHVVCISKTIYYEIGAGGSTSPTWFNGYINAKPDSFSLGCLANYGHMGQASKPGLGGAFRGAVGALLYPGGNGGVGGDGLGGGGGGGAAGQRGPGNVGSRGSATACGNGGDGNNYKGGIGGEGAIGESNGSNGKTGKEWSSVYGTGGGGGGAGSIGAYASAGNGALYGGGGGGMNGSWGIAGVGAQGLIICTSIRA